MYIRDIRGWSRFCGHSEGARLVSKFDKKVKEVPLPDMVPRKRDLRLFKYPVRK